MHALLVIGAKKNKIKHVRGTAVSGREGLGILVSVV